MKFTVAAIAALLAVASSETQTGGYSCEEEYFTVSDFDAGCTPHGSECSFTFNVSANQMPGVTGYCTAFVQAAGVKLPGVPFTPCTNTTIIWSFEAMGLADSTTYNYTLLLVDPAVGLAATKIWDESVFAFNYDGAAVYQSYEGDTEFIVQ